MASVTPTAPEEPASMLKQVLENLHRGLPQDQSPLFKIPTEIRNMIFKYALAQDEDTSRLFDLETYYTRPGHKAPRRCDTALLRTCSRVYREAWFHPWLTSEHIFFLRCEDQRPPEYGEEGTFPARLGESLRLIYDAQSGRVDIPSVWVVCTVDSLQFTGSLGDIMNIPHFYPRVFTITITMRDRDMWFTRRLGIGGKWVATCAFPSSVQQLRVQVESSDWRAAQVDALAEAMASRWRFRRQDGAYLAVRDETTAESIHEVSRWRGTSIVGKRRWVGDEVAPNELEYYVRTVTFSPVHVPDPETPRKRWSGYDYKISKARRKLGNKLGIQAGFELCDESEGMLSERMHSESLRHLNAAGVPRDAPASEVMERMSEYHHRRHEANRRAWDRKLAAEASANQNAVPNSTAQPLEPSISPAASNDVTRALQSTDISLSQQVDSLEQQVGTHMHLGDGGSG